MIRIAICDDDSISCEQIETILLQYGKDRHLKLDVDVFYDGSDFLSHVQKGISYDLLYLDIEMPNMDGLTVSTFLRKELRNYHTEIVYISGKEGYERQLFRTQPLDFIEKPFTMDRILECLSLMLERKEKRHESFRYKKETDICFVPIGDILYFESVGRKIKLVTVTATDFFYGSLKELLKKLSGSSFLQVHRSFLINEDQIQRLCYDQVIMKNDDQIPIGNSYREKIRKMQLERI